MQPNQTELSSYKTENRIHAKTSTLYKLKILWPTNHNLVTWSKTKKNININKIRGKKHDSGQFKAVVQRRRPKLFEH